MVHPSSRGPLAAAARWRACLGSRAVEVVRGALGFALLVVTSWPAHRPQDALSNFTPVFVLIVFWVGMAFASALFGDIFHALNPWRAAAAPPAPRGRRPYPEKLGRWPAAVGLFIFTWIELASGWGEQPRGSPPRRSSTACSRGPRWRSTASSLDHPRRDFSVYYNLFSRLAIFEKRGHVVGVRRRSPACRRSSACPGPSPSWWR